MKIFYIPGMLIFLNTIFSCNKSVPVFTPQGGSLPVHFIVIKDSSFTPAFLTVVSGSTIRFLNQSGTEQRITSSDSIAIAPVSVPVNGFYNYNANTAGIVHYQLANKPLVKGQIIATP